MELSRRFWSCYRILGRQDEFLFDPFRISDTIIVAR